MTFQFVAISLLGYALVCLTAWLLLFRFPIVAGTGDNAAGHPPASLPAPPGSRASTSGWSR